MNSPRLESLYPHDDLLEIMTPGWPHQILEKVLQNYSPNDEFLTIDFFKNGIPFPEMTVQKLKDHFLMNKTLGELDCSFRLTNVQLLSAKVLKMARKLEGSLNRTFSCNLYYTPGQNRNCFDYHVDQQETYVCHLQGMKEWSFPVNEEQHLIHLERAPINVESVKKLAVQKITLSPGDQLHFPYGMVHCAEIKGNEPSIHLTFGSLEHTRDDLFSGIVAYALGESALSRAIKKPITQDELTPLIHEFQKLVATMSVEEFRDKFSSRMFTDNLSISKLGRLYKKNTNSNQD